MNLSFFIANRISVESKGSFSSTISRIAIISIALGLAVLVISFMVLYGFKREIKRKIYSFSGHLIISKYTLSTSYEETSIVLDDSLIRTLEDYPLTERFQPYAMKAGLVRRLSKDAEQTSGAKEEIQGVIFKGVDHQFDTSYFKRHLVEGRFPDFSKDSYATEVAFSRKVANYLRLNTGDEVMIYFVQDPPRYRKLNVVGIYETGLEEFDEKIVFGDLALIRRINNWPDSLAGGIELFIKDISQLERAENDLWNTLDVSLYVDKVTDRYIQIFDWLNLLNRNVIILLVIILFVAGTSIISILLILIMERTRMIGLLRVLGGEIKLIRSVFIWNGLQLIVKGLLWGNVIGISLGLIQCYFELIPLDEATYYMDHVPVEIDIPIVLGLNFLILLLVGLTLFIPASIISRVSPVKAIRFD
ncbi:MAG: ABC transporter permease [Ekhidna sp.]|nr:ABC transporter permease [Ekhidna sp.]